jgi:hypothetical protein
VSEEAENAFKDEMKPAGRIRPSIDIFIEALNEEDRQVVLHHLGLPREKLSNSGAARSLTKLAESLPPEYLGARRFLPEAVRVWRSRAGERV